MPELEFRSSTSARALVLGGGGMLGHKLWQELAPRMHTYVTIRGSARSYVPYDIFDLSRVIDKVDVTRASDLHRAFALARPTVVFNAVGIVKQLREASDPIESLTINSLLPHRLAGLCAAVGAKLIHVSSDCVFSGRRGQYREADDPDPVDLYGRTKLLGEVVGPSSLTIRTSIIGRELSSRVGLLEWFLGNRGGVVRGFRHAIYSGFTTRELARVMVDTVERFPQLTGLWQLSSAPIAKLDLLALVNRVFGAGITIEPDDTFHCDRSLDSSRFQTATGYVPPSWPEMIDDLRNDPTPYDTWKV